MLAQWEQLVSEHYNRLFRLALSLTGDQSAAQECVQQAFLHLFEAIDGKRRIERPSAWLTQVVANMARQQLRERREAPSDPDVLRLAMDACGRAEPDPADRVAEHDLERRVSQILRRCPEPDRVAFELHLSGLTDREIAEALGVPIGTVKTRIHRTRRLLRKALGHEEVSGYEV